ncbi:MAG: hypothetical protein RLP02_23050 [Coleofasciculus sp. C2-GNP5-27]
MTVRLYPTVLPVSIFTARSRIRKSAIAQIQGGAMYGILVSQNCQGLIEHCTLFEHQTGVYITSS